MAFRITRAGKGRGSAAPTLWQEEQVIWGVARRAGLDEQDDPKAHAGLTQHAFEPGNDDRAICGFEPPKRASSPTARPRAQLSMPNPRLNPRCPKCLKLMAPAPAAVTADEAAVEPAVEEEGAATELSPVERIGAEEVGAEAAELDGEPTSAIDPEPTAEMDLEPTAEIDAELAAADTPEVVAEDAAFAALGELTQSAGAPPSPDGLAARLMPPPPPPEPVQPTVPGSSAAARPGIVPPMSMRSASWEGTAVFAAGQMTALVRPPSQPGMGVVASVISGPSGTRVGSVQINPDGLAQISLSEPARGAVSVAWFAVPAVDESLRPGRD
jgi:hypothetical protein